MTLARRHFRERVASVLRAAGTAAGDRVYTAPSWPTPLAAPPVLLVACWRESKVSGGRVQPNFTTTITVTVDARLHDIDARSAQDAMDRLCEQVEVAVLTDHALISEIQQVAGVETQFELNSDGEAHVAQARMEFALEIFQSQEEFDAARCAPPVEEIALQIVEPEGVARPGFVLDLKSDHV